MTEKELKITKRKLTLYFVGIVFLMALLIGILFFSLRFFNESMEDTKKFQLESQEIIQSISGETDILGFLNFEKREKIDKEYVKNRKNFRKNRENLVSYFIVNSRNEIEESNIKESIDFKVFLEDYGTGVYEEEGAMIRKEYINWFYEPVVIYLYKKHSYSMYDYFIDMATFFILILLSSFIFYFIGYRFVDRIMKPVEENLQDMTDFIHNASHEIKTPLAIMRGNFQVMQAEKKLDNTLIDKNIQKIDRLNGLIEGLKELAEVGKFTQKEDIVLAIEVQRVVRDLQSLAGKKDIEIKNMVKGKYSIHANKQEFLVLCTNILHNAILYTPKGGYIEISCKKNILSISDSGKGIEQKQQEKIFERFYREKSVRDEEGFGIGLSLVKKIADANNWKIELESKIGEGSTFRVIF